MSLVPYVGYEMMAGPGLWGAQLNYTWLGERTQKNLGTNSETKVEDGGGLGVATFYEYGINQNTAIGAAVSYAMAGNTKSAGVTGTDEHNTLGVSIYAPIGVKENMTVIPRLDWSQESADNAAAVERNDLAIGAALRWLM
jgi:hypothetical protein